MSASSIPAGRAGGYARYLDGKTVKPERGAPELDALVDAAPDDMLGAVERVLSTSRRRSPAYVRASCLG